jgi:putative component of membrane protein insertase Oxa1/YidC/SpoIIIJ protein YidD
MNLVPRMCGSLVRLSTHLPVPYWADRRWANIALKAVKMYQHYLSNHSGRTCLFERSCSYRAIDYLQQCGYAEGTKLIHKQLQRCGSSFTIAVTANGDAWLTTIDGEVFAPGEVSSAIHSCRSHPRAVEKAVTPIGDWDEERISKR